MKAILLAAGLGTRLRPLTDTIPKCLVPINGKPLLGYWLDALAGAGVSSILINLHHHADQVRSFVENRPDRRNIKLVFEEQLLGTGGTVRENAEFCGNDLTMVIHADNFSTSDLSKFIQAHNKRPENTEITMMTFRTDEPESCGIVEVDHRGVMTRFVEKVENPQGNLANGAVYIFDPAVIDWICSKESGCFDISVDVLPRFVCRVATWLGDGVHIDIGSEKNLERAREAADAGTSVAEL